MSLSKDEKSAIVRVLDVATGHVSPAEFHVARSEVLELLEVKDATKDESADPEPSEVV